MDSSLPPPAIADVNRPAIQRRWVEFRNFVRLRNIRTAQDTGVSPDLGSETAETTQKSSISADEANALEEEVLKTVRMYKSFHLPSNSDIKVTDLPNLESVSEYDIPENIEEDLWAKEASRLVRAVTSDTPLEFIGSHDLALDTASSYDTLAVLADQVWLALNIDAHDAGTILAEHDVDLWPTEMMGQSRMIIEGFCEEEEDALLERMTPERRQDFFTLVDYCTAIIAGMVCASAEGKSLHVNILAYLARISTKLKVLSANLREFAQISLDNAGTDHKFDHHGYSGLRGRPGVINDKGLDLDPLPDLRALKMGLSSKTEIPSKEDSLRSLYFLQCTKFRMGIYTLLANILVSLSGNSRLTQRPLSSYEICAIVYKAGFEGIPTLIYQDRYNDLSGTSDAANLNCARSAFDLLDRAIKHVYGQIERSPNGPEMATSSLAEYGGESSRTEGEDSAETMIGTRISWSFSADGRGGETLQGPISLKSMSHIITVIIPLLMTHPEAAHAIQLFIDMAIYTELSEERLNNPIKPRSYGKYTAFFSLTTEDYQRTQINRQPEDAKSLSGALMRCQNLFLGPSIGQFGASTSSRTSPMSPSNSQSPFQTVQRRHEELDDIARKMNEWVFQEKGVMVHCRSYVFKWMTICTSLVVGGIAVGATVGERVSGVDPFNITTYAWVLAAFLVLVSKSVMVANWPWNDFLHGRVLCKSVSELSSVTGIDDQFIFAKLVQDERVSFLGTRGPYNTVFRRMDDDGFSIDRPLGMWAMMLSGLIMVETESVRGRSLVCLDLRKGTKYAVVKKLGSWESERGERYIHCLRLLDEEGEYDSAVANRIRLTRGNISWLRAVGLYSNQEAKFI